MERTLHVLIAIAYGVVALLIAAVMLRLGVSGTTPWICAGLALIVGAQMHIFGALKQDASSLRKDMVQVRRTANQAATKIASVAEALGTLEARIEDEKKDRHREIVGEMKSIETLVRSMGKRVDTKIEEARTEAKVSTDARALDRAEMLQVIKGALSEGRVDLHLQPIVRLPQRKAQYYECFTRLRDAKGDLIPPSEWLPVADRAGIITDVDNVLLFRVVQIVQRLAQREKRIVIFCNISAESLADEDFFPQFLEFVRTEGDLARSLIFEISQKSFLGRSHIAARNMARLVDFGFRFSVDKVEDPELDYETLKHSGVRFLKINAERLFARMREGTPIPLAGTEIMVADLADYAARFGVQLIGEKIEQEQAVPELIDMKLQLAQGHLFGEPRPVREELLTQAAAIGKSTSEAA
jgi:cyclic-di-GMP phosphodiesterase, flagellum assembly factor TipF